MRLKWAQLLISMLSFVLASCSYFSKRSDVEVSYPREKMEKSLSEIEKYLEQQKTQEAQYSLDDFFKNYPHSIYDLRAKIYQARVYLQFEFWSNSLKVLREVSETAAAQDKKPFLGLAAYYSALIYEALGDEPQTLASLNDAQRFVEFLPLEIAKAELPARFAVYYNRQGDYKAAQKYFHQAEKGMMLFLSNNKELSAKNFFQMGYVSAGSADAENLPNVLKTLDLMQIFSLRSIEMGDAVWSPLASQNLKSNYRVIWNTIQQIPRNKTLDPFAAELEQKEMQFNFIGQLLEVIQKLKSYQRPNFENNPLEKDLYSFFDELEIQAQKMMESISMRSTLTPESQKRQKLKKEGTIR